MKKVLRFLTLAAMLCIPWVTQAQPQLNEGFESTTFAPDDWTAIHVTGSNAWARSTGTGNGSSSAFAYRKDVSGGYNDYLITPKLVPQAGESLSFYLASQYANSFAGTTLTIEVSTTTPTADAFTTTLATYTSGSSGNFGTTGSSDWVNKTVDVSAYVGQEIYIAFHAVDAGYDADVRIDDVTGVSLYVTACPKPTNLAVNYTGGLTASVSWTENGTATNWNIDVNGNVTAITQNPYILTGLSLGTSYSVKVQADCGDGVSDWTNSVNFTTDLCLVADMCDEITIVLNDAYGDGWNGGLLEVEDDLTGTVLGSYTLSNGSSATYTLGVCTGRAINFVYTAGSYPHENGYSITNSNSDVIDEHTGCSSSSSCSGPTSGVIATYTSTCVPATCPNPTSLTASNITTHGVELNWSAGGAETQWQICLNGDEDHLVTANTNPYTFTTELDQDADYAIKVRAYCAENDQSTWSNEVNFHTEVACAVPTALTATNIATDGATISWTAPVPAPANGYKLRYAELGQATVTLTAGDVWGDGTGYQMLLDPTHSLYGTTISTSAGYLSANCTGNENIYNLFGYKIPTNADGECTTTNMVNSTSVTIQIPAGTYDWCITNPTPGDQIWIAASNGNVGGRYDDYEFEPGVTYEFTPAGFGGEDGVDVTITGTPSFAWTVVNNATSPYNLTGLNPATNYRVEVQADCGGGESSNWVPLTFTTLPSCAPVTNLAVGTVTATTVQLTWEDNNGDEATYVVTDGSDNPVSVSSLTATGCTVTGLTASTTYTFKVKADCGGSYSSVELINASTLCEAVTDFPWSENFESHESGNFVDNCWENVHISGSGANVFKVYTSSNAGNATHQLQLPDQSSGTMTKLRLPEMTLPNTNYQFVLDVYRSNSTYSPSDNPYEGVRVYVSTNGDIDGATELAFIPRQYDETNGIIPAESTTGWYTYELPLGISGNCYIILRGENRYCSSTYMDNFSVEQIPTCRKPKNPMLNAPSARTAHTATLKWTNGANDQTAWQIAYSTSSEFAPADNFTPNGTTTWLAAADANPFTITGLAASNTYYAYVRANCGGGDYSAWSVAKATFTTVAGNQVPTGLAVENSTITSSQATASWTGVATNDYHASYEIYWAPAAVDEVPATPTAPNLITGITATSQVIDGLDPESNYKVWVRDYCGTDGYSTWAGPVAFSTVSACQTPNNLAEANVTANSADITWNTYGQSDFNLRYSTDESNWTTHNSVGTSHSLTGLTSNTSYYVQVQANCTPSPSDWSASLNFRTECEAITISDGHPWTEDFEDPVTTATYSGSSDIKLPYCWENAYNDNSGNVYAKPHLLKSASGTSYNYSSPLSQVLYFYGSGNGYATLPAFTNALSELQITFKYATESSSNGALTLGYITAADNGTYNTFTPIGESYAANSTYYHTLTPITVYLNDVPAEATRLVFRWYYSGQYGANIDDIEVSLLPSCYPVGTLAAATEITAHSAKLSWALVDNNQDAWEVQYATNNTFTEHMNTVDADAHTNFMIGGLTELTTYYVRVRANCGGGDYSEWSNTINFSTITGRAVPTGLAVNPATITAEHATASWTAVASNTLHESYDIYWATADVMSVPDSPTDPNLITDITATSQVIDGLDPETDYKVWVRDNCGTDGISEWSSPVAFSTAADCQTPDGLAATNVGTHSATITWNTYGLTQFNVWYKEVGAVEWEQKNDTEQPCDLDGLDANKTYNVKVQPASCASTPEWSDELTFSTPCEAITITVATPYIEDFEDPVTTAVYNTTTPADLIVPACWDNYTNSTSGYAYAIPHIIQSGANYNYSSPAGQVLYFYGRGDGYAALPEFTNPLNALRISFKWATENSSYGTLTLGYITDEDDGTYNTFTQIGESFANVSASNQTMKSETIYLSNVPAAAKRLVFRWYYSGWYGANIDDIMVSLITKDITANQWYAISSPTHNSGDDMTVAGVTNLASGTYDLLGYNETNATWRQPGSLERGKGYIYRNAADKTLGFNGSANSGNIDVTLTATDAAGTMKGWNLLGNPYAHTYALTRDCYSLSTNGTWTVHAGSYTMAIAEAVLVKSAGETFHFTEAAAKNAPRNSASIAFTVSNDQYEDVAFVRFSSEEGLPKMRHLNDEAPMLSIDGYAIANLDESTERFPLHFSGNGEYTLTASSMDDLGYLHLIDRATGRDIDLLVTPEYTFFANGSSSDRFTVRLMPGMDEDGNVTFVRIDGSRLIVDGEGELQVFDVMGRQLGSAQVSGTTTLDRSSLGIVNAGVYVMRLDGNSQKIVVK